jgi:hypothetical protein
MTLEPSRQSFEKPNFMKICPEGAELFHADERTDGHDELIVTFHNSANTPNNSGIMLI